MSTNFTVELEKRTDFGSSSNRKLRRAGKVPVVVYGAGKENEHLAVSHNAILHNLQVEAFHSAIIDIQRNGKKDQAILREVQMHPYRPQVMHVDFQRIKSTEMIHIRVPLHFNGEDVAPGVKTQGGIFSRMILDAEIQCLPKDLPEFLEVDVSHLELNEAVHMSDIRLPDGVELTLDIEEGDDLAIASVAPSRIASELEEMDAEGEEVEVIEEAVEEEPE